MSTRQILDSGLPLRVAGPPDAPRAVIVLQEAFGVNAHIDDVVARFAAKGFYAVAPELYHRDGSPIVAYDDFGQAMTLLGNLTREGLTADLTDTATFLAHAGYAATNTGIVGYCMGGTVATFAATLGLVGASASFYGGGVLNGRFGLDPVVDMVASAAAPWIGLYGTLDTGIPSDHVEALRNAISENDFAGENELFYYDGADHGFHCDDRVNVFNAEAAAQAATETYRFFDEHLEDKL